MPNRFNQLLQSQRYVSNYVPLPFDEILKVGALQQLRQDEAEEDRMELLGKSWNRLPGDNTRALELRNQIDSKLQEYANKDFNDPNVQASWYKDRMDTAKLFSANGEIGRQQLNYDNYKAYEKDILSKSKELGWSTQQIQQHLNQAKNSFMTRGKSGDLNYFQGSGLATRVDTTKWLADNLKIVADDTGLQYLKKYADINAVTQALISGEINHKDYNKIVNSLSKLARGDQELMNSLEQEGLFSGQQGRSKFIKGVDKDGNVQLDPSNPFALQLSGLAEGAQYQKLKQEYITVKDPIKEYIAKRAFDNEALQKEMSFGIGNTPSTPTMNSDALNAKLTQSGNPLMQHFEFKDNKLVEKEQLNADKKVVTIDGKEYNINNLPQGYKIDPRNYSYTKAGNIIMNVVTAPDGKLIEIKNKKVTDNDLLDGYKELLAQAHRAGITGNRDEIKAKLGELYLTMQNADLDYTKFDQGTQAALSKAYNVKTKVDENGDLQIIDPGNLSFSTIKDLTGNLISGDSEDLMQNKLRILSNAKLVGPANTLNNTNYEPGDIRMVGGDGKQYLINTGDQNINNALQSSNILSQSFNRHLQTGAISGNKEDVALVKKYISNKAVSGIVGDMEGNKFISYLDKEELEDNKYRIVPKVMKVYIKKSTEDPAKIEILDLKEANRQLDNDYMKYVLPGYNTKNFDKITKADNWESDSNTEE